MIGYAVLASLYYSEHGVKFTAPPSIFTQGRTRFWWLEGQSGAPNADWPWGAVAFPQKATALYASSCPNGQLRLSVSSANTHETARPGRRGARNFLRVPSTVAYS